MNYVNGLTNIPVFFAELLGDILKEAPKKTDSLDSIIVVDNVPMVGPDRLEKLKNVIRKIFNKFGKVVSEFYPEEDGQTKGCVFIFFLFLTRLISLFYLVFCLKTNLFTQSFANCLKVNE